MNKKINWEELQLNLEIFQKHAGSIYDEYFVFGEQRSDRV